MAHDPYVQSEISFAMAEQNKGLKAKSFSREEGNKASWQLKPLNPKKKGLM